MTATARNLCLHYITPGVTPGPSRRRLALSRDELRGLVERERAARTLADLADYDTPSPPGADRFTLSFDDAHRSVRTDALPVLAALGARATLFVATGYVGTSDEFLTWDDLRALRDAGWTLGAHSVTHPRMSWRLYDEAPEAYARRLDDECARAREALERELGVEVPLFAYPYGEDPDAAREAVRRAGFRAAFTVREGSSWSGDRLSIPRVDGMEAHGFVAPSSQEPTAFSVVVPACDRPAILREVLQRWRALSYPPDRHEVIVVDDGSREGLAPLFADLPRHIRLVASEGDGHTFRAGQARQRGATHARFDTLAFLDADVAVDRDFLWHLDWVHRRVPRAVVLGYLSGYNLHDMGHVHTLDAVRAAGDLAAVPIIPDRSREPALRACLDNLDWLDEPWRLAYTGNLSLPRALFDEIEGFSDEFVGWGLEDVDLGYRLHRAGASWVFSRWAVGWHLVDPTEPTPRNPFRDPAPTRERFAGYLANLATLRRRHEGDPAIERYCQHTLADVEETCGRPDTVGIEFGGACSLDCAFHRAMNRCQPGGATTHELLDRVAYAAKVGARSLYLLGGEPAEHAGFLDVLRAARAEGIRWVATQTSAVPFADATLARDARRAGLAHATIKVLAFDEGVYEAETRRRGSYARFLAGFGNLAAAGVHRAARVVVTRATLPLLAQTLAALEGEGVRVDEVAVVDADAMDEARARSGGRRVVAAAP